MSQSQSTRSICSTHSTNLPLPEIRTHKTPSPSGKLRKKYSHEGDKQDASLSGSNYSNSEDDNGEFQSSHTCSNSGSDDENGEDLDDDDPNWE